MALPSDPEYLGWKPPPIFGLKGTFLGTEFFPVCHNELMTRNELKRAFPMQLISEPNFA